MRFFIVFVLFCALVIFARYWYVCEIKNLCDPIPERAKTLMVKDGDKIVLQGYDQFLYDTNSIQPVLNDDNREFLARLAYYLVDNKKDREITILGRYLSSEQNASLSGTLQENLGLARAEALRGLLMLEGVPEDRIFLDHQVLKDASTLPEEPISFHLSKMIRDTLGTPKVYDKLAYTFKNMTFSDANFEYNSDVFTPGKQFISYADSVQTYLEQNQQKMLTIVGHTDAIGSDTYNDDLGLRRARNAAAYFQDSLAVNNTIKIESRGKRDSVARNVFQDGQDNPDGRQKNRRVNFRID